MRLQSTPLDVAANPDIGQPVVVASHPRSGTHLTLDLLRKQFAACKSSLHFFETLHHLYLNLDGLTETAQQYSVEEAFDLLSRPDRPTVKTHSLPTLDRYSDQKREVARSVLDEGQILYVVRDCRDVLCSMYLWEKKRYPGYDGSLSEYIHDPPSRASYAAERADTEKSYVRKWVRHVEAWRAIPEIHLIKFEDILGKTRSVIEEIGTFLGLSPLYKRPLLPEKRSSMGRWSDYWRRLVGNHESTAILGKAANNGSLDWQTEFSGEDRRYIHEVAGDTLVDLGYEENDHWVHT